MVLRESENLMRRRLSIFSSLFKHVTDATGLVDPYPAPVTACVAV